MDKILGIPISGHYRMELDACPSCGGKTDCHSNCTGQGGPKPNDLAICAHCGALLVFEADLRLREATPEEKAEALADPENGMLIALAITRAKRGRQMRMRRNAGRN